MRESAIVRLSRLVGDAGMDDESAALEKAKYVFLASEIINKRRDNKKPQAKDMHIYRMDDKGNIRESCCGNFDLGREYDESGMGKIASTARQYAAGKGRDVCGGCVGTLYSNRDSGK